MVIHVVEVRVKNPGVAWVTVLKMGLLFMGSCSETLFELYCGLYCFCVWNSRALNLITGAERNTVMQLRAVVEFVSIFAVLPNRLGHVHPTAHLSPIPQLCRRSVQ